MRLTDLLLFGPPLLLGAFGWGAILLSERALRLDRARERQREQHQGPAE